MFSKKFFWFSDEPLEHKHLSGYLSSEKADIAHRNAGTYLRTLLAPFVCLPGCKTSLESHLLENYVLQLNPYRREYTDSKIINSPCNSNGQGSLVLYQACRGQGPPCCNSQLGQHSPIPLPSIADLRFQGEMTDFVTEGLDIVTFTFKIHGQKHTLQAHSRAERDGWIAAIKIKSEEAKAAHEGLVGSEGYKGQLEKFGKLPSTQA